MKRILSFALALALIVAVFLTPVIADNGDKSGANKDKPLTVESVTINDEELEGATVPPSGTIKVAFSNGMTDTDSNDQAITIKDADITITRGTRGDDSTKRCLFVEFKDLEPGDYTLVISAEAQANNGNKLGEEKEVKFSVKAVDPTPSDIPEKAFKDVKDSDWFSPYVAYAVEKEYMSGTSDDTFSPNAPVTRAMVVQVLYAKEGKPEVSENSSFKDVPADKWYTSAVGWAAKNKIVSGFDENTFGPNIEVQRQQLAVILCAYAKYKGFDNSAEGNLNDFSDAKDVASWAKDGAVWAVSHKILSGTNDKKLVPKGSTKRCELATVLKAFDENIVKEG